MNLATLGVGVPNTFQWEGLPAVIADLILQALARQLCCIVQDSRDAMHRARLVNHAFADAVGYLWKLLPPMVWVPPSRDAPKSIKGDYAMRPDAAPGFVEGVMRLAADGVAGRAVINARTYSSIYTIVYSSATAGPPFNGAERLHNAIGAVACALAAEGAFQQLDTTEKRHMFVRFVEHCFLYLDKFYVKRLMLRKTGEIVREALVTV